MIRIRPKYKLVISYDIRQEAQETYYRFVTTEFVPGLRDLGIYMIDVHQTIWGDYPLRVAEFVAESLAVIQNGLKTEKYIFLEERFLDNTINFRKKLIPYQDGFLM